MSAAIRAIEYVLPNKCLDNAELSAAFPEWSIEKIAAKTGIKSRHVAAETQCASDLAVDAAKKLFATGCCNSSEIDFLLLCTQSPDFLLPTTACLIQHRLGLATGIGALDFNLGCSGFVYGLGLAKGLIETGQARRLLLLTAETYTKFLHPDDKSVRTIFGDAAAATLIVDSESPNSIGPFVYGTDGSRGGDLIVRGGGSRHDSPYSETQFGPDYLHMNGAAVFEFTITQVPKAVEALLKRAGIPIEAVDHFVFHQANHFMLEHLRKKLAIPSDRFWVSMQNCGNTVSSTIPIALKELQQQKGIRAGDFIMLVGFGVGFSWGATLIEWV